jgi:hypothetical protein
MDLSSTLTTTYTRVNLHSLRGPTPLTWYGLGHLSQKWGVRSRDLTLAPPSIGETIYSSAVTSKIQTYDPHFEKISTRMSQTFNQGYLLDLHHPS